VKKKVVYAACVNLSGVWPPQPMKCTWDRECEEYINEEFDFGCDIGYQPRSCYITYASVNKKDVQNFILGAKSMAKIITEIVAPLAEGDDKS